MSKAVLISIRSGGCQKIMEGRKTIEVRKTRPKMDTPFKCYIYCTQSADMLWILKERERSLHPDKIADVFKAAKCGGAYRGNGKVTSDVAEVVHGQWLRADDDWNSLTTIQCSLCSEEWCFETDDDVSLLNYKYCPNCGAKMDGGNGDATD